MAAREEELEQILLDELGFAGREELKSGDDIPWPTSLAIPDVDSAFFLNKLPIAYFSRLSELDEDRIIQLHKRIWSQSKAPLLFVTLPHEIRVYNGYHRPSDSEDATEHLLQHLGDLTDLLSAQQRIKSVLVDENHYERIYLETGVFWNTDEGRRINYQARADKQLIDGMGQMRKRLTEAGLSNQVAYTLLGRSIFIRYLEDRKALSDEWFVQATNGMARTYREALNVGHAATYQLFSALGQRFNGDLFPVEPDEENVTEEHLRILLSFLNRTNLETGQLSLWPYDFAYIPIELISHIYDTFIEDRRQSGAYYTPLPLADFILEETLGDDVIRPDMTVLDPACGSGIFLVGAFRRLVQAWQRQYGHPTPNDLHQILRHSIYGVDKKSEAVRIAAFSLYLEILNHLTNEQIQDESFHFPTLQQKNLFDTDFFAKEVDTHFANHKFDRIIGNLPWGNGTLTDLGDEWRIANNHIVGGKQAAPVFMLRAPQFVSEGGEIAFLSPAKSTIFVMSGPHQIFRETFFKTFQVRAVVNFSALVYELFPGAISPASAFFYTADPPVPDTKIVYGVPKPSPLSQHLKAIVLDTTEIKFLSREELLEQPYLWKVAQWGTPRDAALIERLMALPSLKECAQELGWIIGQGYQDYSGRGKPKPAHWLTGNKMLPTNKMKPYLIDDSSFREIEERVFYYPGSPELFKSPLVLIHQSSCTAAYSPTDVAYHHKITGVVGPKKDEWLLRWLVAYLNSPLAKYYHFLTSTSWAVERGTVIQAEYEAMPFLVPEQDDTRLQEVLHNMAQIQELLEKETTFYSAKDEAKLQEYETTIHKLIYELYGLHPIEQRVVEDILTYGIPFFEWAKRKTRKPGNSKPVQAPDTDMLTRYAEIFAYTATSLLRIKNQTLNAVVYKNGALLTVVSFKLAPLEEAHPVQLVDSHNAMRAKLRELDHLLVERKTPSMYTRRHVRVYDGNTVSLVRPSEQRFWTQSQARADADAFLAELSSF
ncbi:MAG: N-6 DNA methylase [Caldilineaceae bacterium]